ncbi:arylesterase [Sphingomonas qomolangmaensis]|uniref:arylesterase n=1 Tax=Sphingomonas qomolangmaensis TaxID=2918765 RepID=UPI003872E9F0
MHGVGWTLASLNKRYVTAAAILQAACLAACGDEALPVAENTATTVEKTVAAARPVGEEKLVLAFGDSLYAGYQLGRGQSLPDAVQNRLRADGINATLVNAGVSGDTSAAGRQRLAFALDNLPRKPDLVLLGLGGNDVLRQIPAAETRANLVAMLDELRRREVPVVLTGMVAPPNLGPEYVAAFNAIYTDLAREYGAALYPFILDGVIGDPALMLPDRIHPNAKGVERVADRVTPLVAQRLAG